MSINKAILVGNVGKDPDVRYIDNGTPVAKFSLATSERGYTLANGTQVPERSEWHNIIAWRGLAEIIEKYVRKGTQLYVEGKITYRSWEDKSGITRYTTEIVAENIQLLGKRAEGSPSEKEKTDTEPSVSEKEMPQPTAEDNNDLPF